MIKAYKSGDLDQVAKLLVDTFIQEPWKERWTEELARVRIEEFMSGPMSIGYVYEENKKIIGVMCGRQSTYLYGKEYFIDEFFISPSQQGRGIGTKMINHVKNDLQQQGFVNIVLNTEKGYPSEAFYKKNNFKVKKSLIFMYLVF
ncbi:MAG TPA: hypothetical protein DDY58_05615 [Terrisporobacter glycolicus]|uniref:GNAT family N-acetyltransferase n=1 Tax=Terrisporobacter TaxID=1505652 RepID=UPI000E96D00F|nr:MULTISPECIES: GNAT family N-acetyltransferase [Terrisporobacter]HBI91943.1 hypothetical protein [Terrisporobacter hibernicus]